MLGYPERVVQVAVRSGDDYASCTSGVKYLGIDSFLIIEVPPVIPPLSCLPPLSAAIPLYHVPVRS